MCWATFGKEAANRMLGLCTPVFIELLASCSTIGSLTIEETHYIVTDCGTSLYTIHCTYAYSLACLENNPFLLLSTTFPHFSDTQPQHCPPICICTSTSHTFMLLHSAALQIRLVGGGSNPFSGRVEYYVQGIWATVCDDYFSTTDGNVVCNQLGYGNAIATRHFGSGSGSIAFDDLACSGNEISLLFCPHLGLFSHNCGHSEDAGVICEGTHVGMLH